MVLQLIRISPKQHKGNGGESLKRKITRVIFIVILLFFVFYLLANLVHINGKVEIPAEKGKMDLSQWNFDTDGIVSLDGEWECYDGQLLEPADFDGSGKQEPKLTGYVDLTSGRKLISGSGLLQAKGIRTYRLVVMTNAPGELMGLKIDNVRMSNKLYVNGKLQGESGNPAEKGQGYRPQKVAYNTFFSSNGKQLEILLQMANYDYPFKGYMYTIILGSQKDISLNNTLQVSVELSFAILSLFFCLFYFFLYKIGSKEKVLIPSLLEFFFIAVGFLFSGNKLIYTLLPDFSFELFCKIQLIGLAGIAGTIISYTNLNSKKILTDNAARRLFSVYLLYSIFVLFTPYKISSYLNPFILSSYMATYVYILWRLWWGFRRIPHNQMIRKQIVLYFICLASLAVTFANHFLFSLNLVANRAVGSASFAVFALLTQFFMAYRFVINHNETIKMAEVKDEFITKISYALKAPLGSIVNISESLLEEENWQGELFEENMRKAGTIKNTALNLLDIVNSTLDVTLLKNDQLKLAITAVDMNVCMELVAESFEDILKDRKIQLIADIPQKLMAEADENRTRQILCNLIHNAVQSMEWGTITVCGRRTGGSISIWVEDSGYGIPEDKKDDIFEPYTALRSQGVGLGLYLARQLAELMGGKIDLEWSQINEGSRFVFSLPANKGKGQPLGTYHQTGRVLSRYVNPELSNYRENEPYKNTVLVVDDEPFNIQTASFILNKQGYRVLTAFSGEEAIRKINDKKVDLVILDVLMPGKSGITICRKIREEYSLIELPVLISTVGSQNDDLVLALKAGANDFISKPFEEKEVGSRVRTLIALKSSMEEAVKNEFAFLQAQIKPHFLYNAINTIVSFCYTDGEKAAGLLTDFSKYLRLLFDMEYNRMLAPLRRELEMIKAYVEIEKARFGEIVNVEYDIAADLYDMELPPLCIQPLVENAIKHGLCEKDGGGTVYVSVKEADGTVVIKVRDTGIGMSDEKVGFLKNMEGKKQGVGFFNVSKRVRGWKNAHLDISSTEGVGTTVTITAEAND